MRKITPFLYFNNADSTHPSTDLKDPQWQRTISMVRKAGEVVMIVEAADTTSTTRESFDNKKVLRLSIVRRFGGPTMLCTLG